MTSSFGAFPSSVVSDESSTSEFAPSSSSSSTSNFLVEGRCTES
eukprot:CAMPEP_0171298856 /NCGR_PEP_ID=MMETSP0816-20121228/7638_1 /TAXON_ID=420281 /ORGANISM="Proboscia inermis, Strain CCAP1064/1" /LENGTH=43 /DNA_ID= /DNA_START= /DNA_END= /DNA_ORIENTATION=